MTLSPDIIEARKWCIETALQRCEDVAQAPGLAAELIALLETGCLLDRPQNAAEIQAIDGHREDDEPTIITPDAIAAETCSEQLERYGQHRQAVQAAAAPAPDDLTDKEQSVLDAIRQLSAGSDWPSVNAVSVESGVPRGSLHTAYERLRIKGYLTRVDGRWALVEGKA